MKNQVQTKPALLLLASVSLILSGCNYSSSKATAIDGSKFGIGTNSETEKKAIAILSNNCASCHGATGAGGVSNITDPLYLLNSGMILPGNPSGSRLMIAIESGRMPPSGSLAAGDVTALRDWITGSGAGTSGPDTSKDAITMIEKNTPELYFGDNRTATVFWNLSTTDAGPQSARFPALFVMDVKVRYVMTNGTNVPVGYQFTNPRIQMLTGELEVETEGVIIRINGVQAQGIEPFLSARKIAKGIDPINIFAGSVNVTLPAVSTGDKISVALGYMNVRARTDNPPIPPRPTLSSNVAFTAQAQFAITVSNDGTARRWCLTAAPATPVSTAAPCPGYENNAMSTGWLNARPTQFDLTTLGRPLTPMETVTFYVWVANSDLKISPQPGSAQVTFDGTAPATPTFTSITVADTQIADINGLQDSNEIVTWCAIEGISAMSVQNSNGCVFSATKPAYIGLKGGGLRYVAIFSRDRAGNLARSTTATVNNPFGRISYDQLSVAANGARAVIANRCFACHGAAAPNQANWDATSYNDTVAKKTNILNRIDNAASPMPATGLLDEKERALIRLWLTQTATPVQL